METDATSSRRSCSGDAPLARAKEIVVMTVGEKGLPAQTAGLVRNLAWHGLRVRAERLGSKECDPANTLLEAARKTASLLVIGGYGHSRSREWVFGGFTQQVLVDAPLPVFTAH